MVTRWLVRGTESTTGLPSGAPVKSPSFPDFYASLIIHCPSRPVPVPVTCNLIQPGGWVGLKTYRDAGHDGLGELAVIADLGFIV